MTVYRSDGTTPVLQSGGSVTQCETLYYEATLEHLDGQAAFESGAWEIELPNGTIVPVTPTGGIPCIGGTATDPNSGTVNDGRGECLGADTSIISDQVLYVVDINDITGLGTVDAISRLSGAYAHTGTSDLPGVSATTPIGTLVETCDDGLFCNGQETCDPDLFDDDDIVKGLCVDGEAPVCDNGLFCDGEEYCDETTDSCEDGEAPICDNGLFCDGEEYCDETTDQCEDGEAPICDNGLFCDGEEYCDETTDQCEDGEAPICDNGLFCDGEEYCDETTDQCEDGEAPICDNGLFCDGEEYCDETTDQCEDGEAPICDNGLFCDGEEYCDETTDQCEDGRSPRSATTACSAMVRSTATRPTDQCEDGEAPICDNGMFCDGEEYCDETTDQCEDGTSARLRGLG